MPCPAGHRNGITVLRLPGSDAWSRWRRPPSDYPHLRVRDPAASYCADNPRDPYCEYPWRWQQPGPYPAVRLPSPPPPHPTYRLGPLQDASYWESAAAAMGYSQDWRSYHERIHGLYGLSSHLLAKRERLWEKVKLSLQLLRFHWLFGTSDDGFAVLASLLVPGRAATTSSKSMKSNGRGAKLKGKPLYVGLFAKVSRVLGKAMRRCSFLPSRPFPSYVSPSLHLLFSVYFPPGVQEDVEAILYRLRQAEGNKIQAIAAQMNDVYVRKPPFPHRVAPVTAAFACFFIERH